MLRGLLWTGGKDCTLTLHLLELKYQQIIDYLVVLVPVNYNDESFQAHKISRMREQAMSLAKPIVFVEVSAPYDTGYAQAFTKLKVDYQISTIYTGDIDFYDNFPDLIKNGCQTAGIQLIKPLWHKNRNYLVHLIFKYKIKVQISYLSSPLLSPAMLWKDFDHNLVTDLKSLPIDLCGELGEYHTMAYDGLLFHYPLTKFESK